MKKLLPFNYWTVSLQGDTAVIGIFEDAGAIHWDAVDPLNLPQDLIGVENGKLCWLQPGGVERSSVGQETRDMSAIDGADTAKRPSILLRFLANNDGVLGFVFRHTIKACVLRPAVGICWWCHSVLNSSTNVESSHTCPRARLRLWFEG